MVYTKRTRVDGMPSKPLRYELLVLIVQYDQYTLWIIIGLPCTYLVFKTPGSMGNWNI